jgi:4-amino-4-deoxy-L-arabinose transferase-like glycosyltransferase
MVAERDNSFGRMLVAVAAAALVLRLALRAVAGADAFWVEGYGATWLSAQELAAGQGYALPGVGLTAYRVPLYPIFLAAVTGGHDWPWAVMTAQAIVSAGTVFVSGLIARALFGPQAGLVAAAVCVLWPYYAWHDTALQETGLFTFLSAAATFALLRSRGAGWMTAAAAGLLLGLAALTRSTILPFAALALPWLWWWAGRRAILAAAAALLAVLAPWLVWSAHVTGEPGFGTEFGAALYAGNHQETFSAYPAGSIDESRARAFAALSPAELAEVDALGIDTPAASRWYAARGIAWIEAHPGQFAVGFLRKNWAAFGPWPSPRHNLAADLAYAATWLPLLLAGLAGLWLERGNWRRDLLFTGQFACFALISGVLWAQTSHRAPLDVLLMVFAARALVPLAAKLRLPLPG